MRRVFVLLLTSLLMIICPAMAFAEKITVDPNTPQAVKPVEQTDKPDERLAQKVTYEARRKMVSSILTDLTEKTGVTLKAGLSEKDWQVRDLRMNIFAKDVPLADLMSSIARVMKFKWEIGNKDTVRTYRLFMDRKTLLDAENSKLREEQQREQMLAKKREKMLNEFARVDKLSPQELEKLKQDNPFMYVAATSGMAGPLAKFFQEVPMATEALATGQELSLGAGSLSPIAQQALVQSMIAMAQLRSKMGDRRANIPDDFASNPGQISVQLNRHYEDSKNRPMGHSMLGEITMRVDDQSIDMPFFDHDSTLAKMLGKAIIKSQEEDRPMDEVMRGMQGEMMSAVVSDIKKDDSGEPAVEHPEDPDLDVKIKLKPKENRLEEIEAALADASKMAVVSDSFGQQMGMLGRGYISDEEMSVREALEKIAETRHYNWDKRNGVIELRDRNWYRKRLAQIPEARIEAWRETLKKTGTLDLDALVHIAALNQEEFNDNITSDEDLMRCNITGVYFGNRDVLRAYGALSESQRSAVFSANGLNLAILSPDQWNQLEKLITQRNPSYLQGEQDVITLHATRTQQGKLFDYAFTISSADDLPPIVWRFTTPEYKEPEKK
ncbi:MAG: hypothetical protein M1133_11160 [Armatimonadetes bacterium]|nr:hypothetical protein [Armatimonadota bacterium]